MKPAEKPRRNGAIDVIKFISCLFIVMYHFNIYTETKQYFSGGKFGVEVFCIIAGAFFYLKYVKQANTITTWSYAKYRFLRFFPYTTSAFILLYAFLHITGRERSLGELANLASEYIWEVLLVGMTGINAGNSLLNSPTWTISCLLIAECAILGLLICSKKLFFNFIAPISLVIIYGVWSNLESINYRVWLNFVNFGVLQVWCCIIWGILAVLLSKKLSKINHSSKALTAIECVCYLLSFIIMLTRSNRYWGFTLTLCSFIAIAITPSQKSYSSKLFADSKLTRWLGNISLAIYLNHSLILKIFQKMLSPEQMFSMWPLFLVVLFIFATLFDIVLKRIIRYGGKLYTSIKQYYLLESKE